MGLFTLATVGTWVVFAARPRIANLVWALFVTGVVGIPIAREWRHFGDVRKNS
jgi:hypothetical protein